MKALKPLILLVVCVVLIILARRGRHQGEQQKHAAKQTADEQRAQSLLAETNGFAQAISELGALPSLHPARLHLQPEEFALLHQAATRLMSYPTVQVPTGKPRHVVAGLDSYTGPWQSQRSHQLSELAQGDLFLTNKRLVFLASLTPW